MMKKVMVLLLFSVLIFNFDIAKAVGRDGINLPNVYLQPGTIYYPLVRSWEKFSYAFYFGNWAKLRFNRDVLRLRIAEFKQVAEDHLLGEVEKSSERITYYTGVMTDVFLQEWKSNKDRTSVLREKDSILDELSAYQIILAKSRDEFEANSSYWMLAQQSIDAININMIRIRDEAK